MGFWRGVGNFLTFGAIDRIDANRIVNEAKAREESARNDLETQKKVTQQKLSALGVAKKKAFEDSLIPFVAIFKEVGHVDITPIKHLDGIDYNNFCCEYTSLKQISTTYKELALVGGGGALAGAVAVGGAIGLATMIGTASTGTAIGTLSGAAATNATLAWLGGGAVSAGGAGVVGGMVVLGGIAIAPIAIFGMFMGASKGKQKLNAANDYSDQVDVIVEKIITLIEELKRIDRGADLFRKTIVSLEQVLLYQNVKMQMVIVRLRQRNVWHKYVVDPVKKILNMQILTDEEAEIFQDTANCAYLLKKLLDMPLMNEDGSFFEGALDSLEKYQNQSVHLLEKNGFKLLA